MADWGRLHIGKLDRVGPGKKARSRRPPGRVEEGRGTDTGLHADPFPFPAHQTGRALFGHPAFRQTSPTAHGRRPKWTSRSRNTPKSPNTTASEKRVAPREATLWRLRRKFRTRS